MKKNIWNHTITTPSTGESNNVFKLIFENSSVGKSITSVDGKLKVNRAFCDMLGYSEEEMHRLHWMEITHPDDIEASKEMVENLIRGISQSARIEKRYLHKSGSIVWALVNTYLQHDSEGEPQFFITNILDITNLKKTEAELQLSKERLLFATEGANLGVWNWDILTGELIWSDRCKALFGIGLNEMMSYPRFRAALHPDDRERTDKAVKESLDNHKDYDIEYRSLWTDQSIHWLSAKGRGYYDSNGVAIRMEGVVMDINDHKNAVESLRENEERYKLANLATFNIIWDWDLRTNSLLWNDHFKTQFGYAAEEIEPGIHSWTTRIHPEDLCRVETGIHNAIDSGENYWNDQYRFICKNGKQEDIEDRGYIVRDPRGHPLRMIGAMRVVTEHKKAEAKLKESLALLRIAGETAKLGGWSVRLNENRSYWSDQVAAIHGMPAGYNPLVEDGISFYAPEWREKITHIFTGCAQKGIPYNEEMEIITANGKRVWVQTIGEAVRDENNNIVQVNGAFQDISARKQAEESLKRYTERLRNLHKIDLAILQSIESPEAIAKTALHHIRELLNCQRASVGIFDLEKKNAQIFAADVAGKTIVQLGEILTDEVYGDIEILHQGKMEIIEDMTKVKSPSLVSMILQSEGIQASINVPLVSAQKLYGVLNVGWDASRTITREEMEIAGEVAGEITLAVEQAHLLDETKRYAAELEHRVEERTSQLVNANKEMESFSYSVSHDLRAPLRHISGYVELLLNRFHQNLPEKAQHYLNTISDSIGDMGNLIDDLLKFSRTGKMELNLKPINMKQVFDEALSQVKEANPGRIIKWNISSMPTVIVDYNLLSMVWYNLISNAVKFTRNRKTAKIEVGVKEEESQYIFYVRDNGVGFDMQYAQKLFGVFQRLHPVADFEGTGIGLANVRRTISRHGGITWAEAAPDKGATFYFTLPKK
ncbi:MAG: PAS domain-containing protein [Bacteroidetes bacterium]|nr:PAS domain-containing protein [Bacteroidota bacterium]